MGIFKPIKHMFSGTGGGTIQAKDPATGQPDQGPPSVKEAMLSMIAESPALPHIPSTPADTKDRFHDNSPASLQEEISARALVTTTTERVRLLSMHPHMYEVEDFLTDEESTHLKELVVNSLARSKISATGGGAVTTPNRTSSGCFVPTRLSSTDPIVIRIENRIAKHIGCSASAEGGAESLYVIRYLEGEFFKLHFDNKHVSRGERVKRSMTIMLYLSDVEEGGQTIFPLATPIAEVDDLTHADGGHTSLFRRFFPSATSRNPNQADPDALIDQEAWWQENIEKATGRLRDGYDGHNGYRGVIVQPKRNKALFFHNTDARGDEDLLTVHAGLPVVRGVKWAATKWVHGDAMMPKWPL